MRRVTDSQIQLLTFIADYREQYGNSPTFREIMEAIGINSTNAIDCRLYWLERKGLIDRGADGKTRQVRLTEAGYTAIRRRPNSMSLPPFAAEIAIEELGL